MIKLVALAILLIGLFVVGQIDCHPSRYVKRDTASNLGYASGVLVNDTFPAFTSWHIHIQFVNSHPARLNGSLELRDRFIKQFNLTDVEECDTDINHVDDNRLCMFPPEIMPDYISPFVSGNWAAMIPLNWFAETVTWIAQFRGDFDILIHPNSGLMANDHVIWSLKAGQDWPLNTKNMMPPRPRTNPPGAGVTTRGSK